MKEPDLLISFWVWLVSGLSSAVISIVIERITSGHIAAPLRVILAVLQGVTFSLAGIVGVLLITNQLAGTRASEIARISIPVGAGQGLLFGLLLRHQPAPLLSVSARYLVYAGILFLWSLIALTFSVGGSTIGLLASAIYFLFFTSFWPVCYEILSKLLVVWQIRRGTVYADKLCD